jgi:hypothetical protein
MTQSVPTQETVSSTLRQTTDIPVENALYGSFLPIPSEDMFPIPEVPKGYLAGAVVCKKEKIKFNVGKKRWAVEVKNAGDRPIQVCLQWRGSGPDG